MPPEPPNDAEEPHWMGEALRAPPIERVVTWLSALARFTARPRVFAREWAAGRETSLNPLLAMALSASLVAPVHQELARMSGGDPRNTLIWNLATALAPYPYYAALTAVVHGLLRLGRSAVRFRTSLGVTLIAGAGPGALISVPFAALMTFIIRAYGASGLLTANVPVWLQRVGVSLVVASYLWFLGVLAAAMAGAHRCSALRAAACVAVAVVAVGFALGLLAALGEAPSSLGPHLVFRPGRSGEPPISVDLVM